MSGLSNGEGVVMEQPDIWAQVRATAVVRGVRALHDAAEPPPWKPPDVSKAEIDKLTFGTIPLTVKGSKSEAPPASRGGKSARARVAEFLSLPPEVQEQALQYARRWRDGVSR